MNKHVVAVDVLVAGVQHIFVGHFGLLETVGIDKLTVLQLSLRIHTCWFLQSHARRSTNKYHRY